MHSHPPYHVRTLTDIKLDKLRDRSGGEVNENNLKKSEIAKCNSYSKGVLAMFAHFTNMYAATDKPRNDAFLLIGKSSNPVI